ncbi:MAG: asparagine synthetase B, partial [Nanoarchaeota archaeon]|nr:asparagine synthetase B [Nanoarchaeota archaeon]
MCGINGFNWKDKNLIENMNSKISHRGPDQNGIYVDDNFSFGHQRLSIIDLSENGRQPMFSSDKKIMVVFNGEIFNFVDLRNELSKKYKFKSKSDTEVLIYGYKEWG